LLTLYADKCDISTKMKRPIRPNRFKREDYRGRITAFTICVENRAKIFTEDVVFEAMVRCLKAASEKHNCVIPAFCFMPDHGHILVLPADDEANSLDTIDKFRLQSGIWLYNHHRPGWQPGSWDEPVGSSRSWRAQARYIVLNPVRAGLVENWSEYPYLGSLTGEVNGLFED